jgi:hypothetical protein
LDPTNPTGVFFGASVGLNGAKVPGVYGIRLLKQLSCIV